VAEANINRIAQERARLGLTVEQAAAQIHVPPRQYREIEAGTRWPDAQTWERMRRLFGWP
jgi:transcriptional regulator with XRE-family HTH domain